jgi:chitinase
LSRTKGSGSVVSPKERLLTAFSSDDQTKNPWLTSPDHTIVIGYDDAESVAIKTEWAMKKGFRGVFFWQINADRLPDGTNPLQEASRKKWDESVRKGP